MANVPRWMAELGSGRLDVSRSGCAAEHPPMSASGPTGIGKKNERSLKEAMGVGDCVEESLGCRGP